MNWRSIVNHLKASLALASSAGLFTAFVLYPMYGVAFFGLMMGIVALCIYYGMLVSMFNSWDNQSDSPPNASTKRLHSRNQQHDQQH